MSCEVLLVAEAEHHLVAIDAWWSAERPTRPNLFLDEFERGVRLLSQLPEIGPLFSRASRPGVRRLLLQKSRHWLYHTYDREHGVVYVLAIWSAHRGEDPPLE